MKVVTIFLLVGKEIYSHPNQRQMKWIHESFLLIKKSSAYAAETNNKTPGQEFLSSINRKGALICIWEI